MRWQSALPAWRMAVVAVASIFVLGCGGRSPRPLDKAVAKDSVRTALACWKSGVAIGELKQRSPSIVVGDSDWRDGAALLNYHIVDDESDDGSNLHCEVELTIRGRNGKENQRRAVYIVGTSPVITIFEE